MFHLKTSFFLLVIATWCAVHGQPFSHKRHVRLPAANVLMPQSRSFAYFGEETVNIVRVDVGVDIIERVATVEMDIHLYNPCGRQLEAELIVPVPADAAIKGFSFEGNSEEPAVQLLPKEEASRLYRDIVSKLRDPALLEFIGYQTIRSSVFPVEARGKQKIRLSYEHLLSIDGNRMDFVMPRSQSLHHKVPWNISLKVHSKRPISTVYSPTHKICLSRLSAHSVRAVLDRESADEPGPFRLSCLIEEQGVTASLLAYPDPPKGGGYFLLLAGLPASCSEFQNMSIRRDLVLVIDRSGSMKGEKMKQVKHSAMQVLQGLEEGESFNLIVYNQATDLFSPEPVLKNDRNLEKARFYLENVFPSGGTNIHEALVEGLRQRPRPGSLPIMLFLTDGLPTIGRTSESAIRSLVKTANPNRRRIFTFGVGAEVNTPLLESIASLSRATATFILPEENVGEKVTGLFKRLYGPVFSDLKLCIRDAEEKTGSRAQETVPSSMPDLFAGDQLVLTGRYLGERPITFEISGNYLGKERTFRYTFGLEKASTQNSFVPRLWATRQIAVLISAIRELGADRIASETDISHRDPSLKELVDEVVRLSTEFGILTEYTAFLAREGTDLTRPERVLQEARQNFIDRAWNRRSGISSVNQERNSQEFMSQKHAAGRNRYWDERMNRVEISQVQQVQDLSFYHRAGKWVDSRIVDRTPIPDRTILFGSPEFWELAARLAEQGRQGCIALSHDVLLFLDGKVVLIKTVSKK